MGIKQGIIGVKEVTDSAVVEAVAGTYSLPRRHTLIIHNSDTTNPLYYGYASTVTASTGMPIAAGASMAFDFEPATYVPVYLITGTGITLNAIVEECA